MNPSPILYVEDEEDYQMLVQRILGKAGLQVTVAETGQEGMSALERQRPRLLILDINLPDTDGYSICSKLREDPAFADLPILMLTVRRRPEEWLRGFSSGADDYVSKPLNPPELIERVQACLDGKLRPSTIQGTPEYQLIQAALGGNRPAFEILIQQYKSRLVEGLMASGRTQAEVEDMVSAAFLRAYANLNQFRGESSFYTWLYRIAQNELQHLVRRAAPVSLDELSQGDESALPAALRQPDILSEDFGKQWDAAQLREAIARVPQPFRDMLEWHFIRGAPYQAIAKRFDIPVGTVMSRLYKARILLQQAWGK